MPRAASFRLGRILETAARGLQRGCDARGVGFEHVFFRDAAAIGLGPARIEFVRHADGHPIDHGKIVVAQQFGIARDDIADGAHHAHERERGSHEAQNEAFVAQGFFPSAAETRAMVVEDRALVEASLT